MEIDTKGCDNLTNKEQGEQQQQEEEDNQDQEKDQEKPKTLEETASCDHQNQEENQLKDGVYKADFVTQRGAIC